MSILEIIGAVIGVALAALGYGVQQRRKGRSEGRRDERNRQNAETIQRTQSGRDAVQAGRDSGLSPTDRVQSNNDAWK